MELTSAAVAMPGVDSRRLFLSDTIAAVMTIRPAKPDDVQAVLPMVAAVCAMHEAMEPAKYAFVPDVAEMYSGWLVERSRDPGSVFLVAANREEKVVAFLVGTVEREIPIYRIERFGFIHDLWVEPEYRNEGIGRQLVMLAIERFEQIGMKQIRLDTAGANEAARNLFAACGFRVSTTEMLAELK
jgi:ribosomal protein S18 acetylase RimI-like enzyme